MENQQNIDDISDDEIMRVLTDPLASFAEKMKYAMIKGDKIEKMNIGPFLSKEDDGKIKRILLDKMFSMSSAITCPLCQQKTKHPEMHLRKHEFIFVRGCVYCHDKLLMGDFYGYYSHIQEAHPHELQKPL